MLLPPNSRRSMVEKNGSIADCRQRDLPHLQLLDGGAMPRMPEEFMRTLCKSPQTVLDTCPN